MTVNETERKLAEYRARKEKEKLINNYKNQAKNFLSKLLMKKTEKVEAKKEDLSIQCSSDTNSENELSDTENHVDYIEEEPRPWTIYNYLYYILWFLMWATIYAIFIKFQFGTVYLILSGLVGMYLNTRTGPKRKNEVSAYSVFNENCEKIDGTLDGEQMTKQMLYGGFSR